MDRDLASDLDLAQRLATHVAPIAKQRFEARDFAVRLKHDGSPVTDVDLAVERAVRHQLAQHRPDDAILGEELGMVGDAKAKWIIDPIDGTENFVAGSRQWGIQIALSIAGEIVLGVIDAPLLHHRWWAARGMGAYRDGERLVAARTPSLQDALITDRSAAPVRPAEIPSELLTRLRGCVAAGPDIFWPELLVAEGIVDIDIGEGGAEWDLAPRSIVVIESGGRFTDLNGNPGIQSGRALCSGPLLHSSLIASSRPRPVTASTGPGTGTGNE